MVTPPTVSRICCIGAGYVGGPTSAVMALNCPEIQVTVVDSFPEKIEQWNTDELPIAEPGLLEIVKKCRGKNLHFSADIETNVKNADIIFISVNTPTKEYGQGKGRATDLTALRNVSATIADCCTTSKVVVEKSTVPVRAAVTISEILHCGSADEKNGGQATSRPRHVVLSNPEFLAEGTAIHNLLHPDRVLIGGDECSEEGMRAISMLKWVYSHWVPATRVLVTSTWSSELSKLAANAFLAQRISSINAISAICEETGADVRQVAKAVGTDSRMGPHFLQASLGFGGSCFKKDILNLVYLCESLNLPEVADYWNAVIELNTYRLNRFGRTILSAMFGSVNEQRIAIFGFAFKKDTGDTREAPAINLCGFLMTEKASLAIYDPQVPHKRILDDLHKVADHATVKKQVTLCSSAQEAAVNASAIVICTEWNEFTKLDFRKIHHSMCKPAFVFDGRLILDHNHLQNIGFTVHAIGLKMSKSTEVTKQGDC